MVERMRVDPRRWRLCRKGRRGAGPVVYWMSREQRLEDNWPLLMAQDLALASDRGLVVLFCLQRDYLEAGARHFRFMINGLRQLAAGFDQLGMPFLLKSGFPRQVVPEWLARLDACALVTDFNPLRISRSWRNEVFERVEIPCYEVDGHNIVPCWHVSDKKEYSAATFRPKVTRLLPEFLTEFPLVLQHPHPPSLPLASPDWSVVERWSGPGPEQQTERVARTGGGAEAQAMLARFVDSGLDGYAERRNDPLAAGQSGLSPYFHFGQLSAQRAALAAQQASAGEESRTAFLEELIVRRELADNFCYYCPQYDSVEGFPNWAQKTLDAHRGDPRPYRYGEEEFQLGLTHQPLWNCCQRLLVRDGTLHGYLRMYWAKKILEWSDSPEEGLRIGLKLNDAYAYDGRDPNGYTGLAWSIGGVHDRAWAERPVFGKIRYMNSRGCRRKFAVDELLARHQLLLEEKWRPG